MHTFSNGGSRVYCSLSDLIHNSKTYASITLRGVIFDSCPSRPRISIGLRAYMSVCNHPFLVKYFLTGCLFLWLSVVVILSQCAQYVSSTWTVTADFWSFMCKDPANCPHLYLYSVADKLIPYKDVDQMIAERRSRGVDVSAQCWDDSAHVSHFVAHRETYITACLGFLERCSHAA